MISLQKILFSILIFSLPAGLMAQEDEWFIDKPIASIIFDGLKTVKSKDLKSLMRPYMGVPYTDAISWEIQSTLYALDYFDLIIPEIQKADSAGNSLNLIFQVQEKPIVDSIRFEGNNKIRRGRLLDTVLIKNGDLLNTKTLEIDEQAIAALYVEKGFVNIKVASNYIIDEQNNLVTVVFDITEGSQTKISKINFVGNSDSNPDSRLLSKIKTKAQSLFSKGDFVEVKLQEDIKILETYYQDRGYIDARISEVEKNLVFDEKQNVNKLEITINIFEGDIWTYGGMTFEGNELYSLKDIESTLSQRPGDVFSLTRFNVDYQRVTDIYFENGYIFNSFSYEQQRDEVDKIVSYKVNIQERDRAYIDNIIIRGNYKTKSYVIRRAIPLDEGEVFSKTKILEGTRNLYNLRYFTSINPQPYPGETDGLMDLVIDVVEGRTTDVIFGLVFSGGTDFPLSGQLKWTDRNFLGRGQILGAETTLSPDVQKISLNFSEPNLLGLNWSGGVDLSWQHSVNRRINQDLDGNGLPDPYLTWEEYDSAGRISPNDRKMEYGSHRISLFFGTGYSWFTSLGEFGIGTGLGLGWRLIYYDQDVFRPQSQSTRNNLDKWLYDDNISLRLYWDTRDLKFDATRGFVLSQRFVLYGIMPFSNINFLKSTSRFNYNLLLFSIPTKNENRPFQAIFYFNSAFQALLDKPWGGIRADENTDGFYIDGMFIGRGWKPASGFRYLWDNTVQIKFPLLRNILSFDLFLDVVGAWRGNEGGNGLKDMKAEDWRFALGGGLRFANPQFPIGIYVVKKFQFDSGGNVNWAPERSVAEFRDIALDLVIAFDFDIY